MAVDRDLWRPPFTEWPSWPCPSCRVGRLQLVEGSLKVQQTGPSAAFQSEIQSEPEDWCGRFIALFVCGNSSCKDIVSVCGWVRLEELIEEDPLSGEWKQEYKERYTPTHFLYAAPLFPIPKKCPGDVKNKLRRAFSLYWSDASACANALRVAVEQLLDNLRVKKLTLNAKGKRVRVTLHNRIVILEAKRIDVAKLLMAVKWLGNDGSHEGDAGLTNDDLMDAFDIFEHVLDLLYVKHGARVARLASAINKRKGGATKRVP